MTRLVLQRVDGQLSGVSEEDQRAYARFKTKMERLEGTVVIEYRFPRSSAFHRRHFGILGALFDAQEQFDDPDAFRKWGEVGAGHVRMLPGPTGRMVAMPDSIKYERLEQVEFEQLHAKVIAFYRSKHATRFLWPHLEDAQASELVETVLRAFE